jgi:hypothetical protein
LRIQKRRRERATYRFEILEGVEFRAESTVDAKELLVHDGGKWETAKGLYTRFIHLLGVLVLAFQLEGEIVGQMPAFVISAQKPERVWIPNLQSPEIENALCKVSHDRQPQKEYQPQC